MATLRAGAQYVPLDPRWPLDRLVSLIEQLRIRHIGCDGSALEVAQAVQLRSERSIEVVCAEPRATMVGSADNVIDLFEQLALEEDPLVANSFVVRGGEDSSMTDMDDYHRTVWGLLELLTNDRELRLIDLGCGPGTLAARVANLASSVVCVDPSYECVRRTRDHFADQGIAAVGEVTSILEIVPELLRDRTVALLASVAQFLPDLETFVETVGLAKGMTVGDGPRHIVLADLFPPEMASGSLLGVPRALVSSLGSLIPEVQSVAVHEQTTRHPLLRQRYNAVPQMGPATSEPRLLVHPRVAGNAPEPWGAQ
ncbi:methyltransferase domain-containing protein [Nocardiopsis sp. NPDC006198]|uniref:methyltransferase domain-containing protein n=1 Tax=Nocardiopsis sp. NPDC006198 TaxID=3154472 RepID=UPI0033A190AA